MAAISGIAGSTGAVPGTRSSTIMTESIAVFLIDSTAWTAMSVNPCHTLRGLGFYAPARNLLARITTGGVTVRQWAKSRPTIGWAYSTITKNTLRDLMIYPHMSEEQGDNKHVNI